EGDYLTLTIDGITYYYPGTKSGDKTWYWGTVTQKNASGEDTVTWHKATELNADGTVKSYYGVTTEGARYGNTINDSIAFGNIRNMMWLNHTTIYYRSKGWLDGTERKVQEGSDFYANRWYYRSVGYIASNATTDQANYDYLSDDRSLLRTYGAEDPFVLTLTQEAKETATGVGIYFDNKAFWRQDTPTSLVATHVPTSGGMYQVKGIAGDYYAVRVYTKVLSETEKLQNYFVDVCAYNGLDVTGVKELMASDPDAAQAMFLAMADFSIRDPRVGAMQAVIDAAIEGIVPTAAKMNAYDKLYVQEGLKALFTAFHAEGSGLDLAAGTWTDKKSGTSITLVDNSSNTNWELGANNQGVGYAFRNMVQLNSDKLNVGMRLPTNALSDESMAVEYTFAIAPVLKADGTQDKVIRIDTGMKSQNKNTGKYTDVVYRYTAGGQWGLYNGSTTSNFSFGGLQMCFFHLSGNPQGNSMCMRMFYSGKPFENTAGGNDRAWIEGHGFFGSSSYNTDVQTLTVNRGVTVRNGEGAYNRVDIDVLLNRVSKAKINNDGGSSEQKMFYTLDSIANDTYTASSAADAFFGMPSTVYAIRIYSDTLTDAQMKQNHAVDLMAYFGLDVRGFAAAAEAKKTAVYEAFAAYTF
ncbi:MAG: hypothetical protein IIW19_03565, partial [Clostridia bacterium]|nr:hypothetical protein [Clostridia bacterium]